MNLDDSKRLDRIIQLLQRSDGLVTLSNAIDKLDLNSDNDPGFHVEQNLGIRSDFQSNFSGPANTYWKDEDERPSIQLEIQSDPPVTVVDPSIKVDPIIPVDRRISDDLLERIMVKVSSQKVVDRDLTDDLFSINENLGQIKQLFSVYSTSNEITSRDKSNLLLEQILDSISELVEQSNDNSTMLQELKTNSSSLRQGMNEVNALLVQNMNYRNADIQALIDESSALIEQLQKFTI